MSAQHRQEPTLRDGLQDRRDCEADHRDGVATERDITQNARQSQQDTRSATDVEIRGLWACLSRIESSIKENNLSLLANNELINNIFAKGCARAESHERQNALQDTRISAIEIALAENKSRDQLIAALTNSLAGQNTRLSAIEVAIAQNRGRDITLNALFAGVISLVAVFFGKMWK